MQPKRIFHPVNLEREAEAAFLHALRIALAGPAVLTLMHVGSGGEEVIDAMPGVRATLRRWGAISKAEGEAELRSKGIGVRKLVAEGEPVQACLDHLQGHEADLVVMHTHQREGGAAWFHARVAEPLARASGRPALIVPGGVPGFVRPENGAVTLGQVLVPVALKPSAQAVIQEAAALAGAVGAERVRFTLLHVGDERSMPMLNLPERDGWAWEAAFGRGDVVEAILEAERRLRPDLVVMATEGHDGVLDVLRGSRTERVLRRIHCPMLVCPS